MWTTHRTPTGNANGHKDYIESLARNGHPVTAMVTDNFGIAKEGIDVARQYGLEEQSTVIYRLTRQGQQNWRDPVTKQPVDWDVPNYSNNPIEEANFYFDATMRRLEIEDFDDRIHISFVNEIDKNRSEWLATFGLQIAKRVVQNNLRCVLFNWNSGEPEYETWIKPEMVKLLKFMAQNPHSVKMGIHEYSFNSYIFNDYPNLVGRFLSLEDACVNNGIDFNNIGICITEFGHGKDGVLFPSQSKLEEETKQACDLYYNYPNIRLVAHWVISDNSNWGDAGKRVQKLYEPMKEYTLNKQPHLWFPNTDSPTEPEPEDYSYYFDGSWYDVANKQVPENWKVKVAEGCHPESDCKSWNQFADPECRHLTEDYLPSDEWYFLNEKGYCYKIFHGSSPFEVVFDTDFVLKQNTLYKIKITLTNDFYVWSNGAKNPNLLDDNHAYLMLGQKDDLQTVKINKVDYLSSKEYEATIFTNKEDVLSFGVGTIWGIPNGSGNNGVFIKQIEVSEMVEEPLPKKVRGTPRVEYKKIVVLVPQDLNGELYGACSDACFETKTTLMMSADDAGSGSDTEMEESPIGFLRDVHVIVLNPDSWKDSIVNFYQENYPAVVVHLVEGQTPETVKSVVLDTIREIKGESTEPENPKKSFPTLFYHINSYYGDDRPWGAHRGTDLRCYANTPIFSYMDGVVSKINVDPNASGWGKYVRVLHSDGHESIYAHNEEILVEEGQIIESGFPIAIAGSTGNSTGVHLHFELRKDNKWFDNTNIVKEMIDVPELSNHFRIVRGFVWKEYLQRAKGNDNYLFLVNSNVRADSNSSAHSFGVAYKSQVAVPTGLEENGYMEVVCHLVEYSPLNNKVDFGVHASANPETTDGAIDVMNLSGGKVVKVLSNITPQSMTKIVNKINAEKYIVRAFLDFGHRVITPQQFVNDTISDVKRTLSLIPIDKSKVYIELHNEPNLRSEGFGSSWSNPKDFVSWLNSVVDLYKQQLPEYKYLFPAMSPGFANNDRQYHMDYYNEGKSIFNKFNGIAVHSYWSNDTGFYGDNESGIALLERYRKVLGNYPMFVTEASNNIGYNFTEKGSQYASFLKDLSGASLNIDSVIFFVVESLPNTYESELWFANGKSTGILESFVNSI